MCVSVESIAELLTDSAFYHNLQINGIPSIPGNILERLSQLEKQNASLLESKCPDRQTG